MKLFECGMGFLFAVGIIALARNGDVAGVTLFAIVLAIYSANGYWGN